MIGKTLAHYEISELIGKGGMGEVYRARDTKLDRDVAIKVLPREMSGDPERIARFRREARTLASLQHNNIAAIHGFEDTPEARFLVMELIEGEDLEQLIARGPIAIEEAADLARQIAAGLEAAHDGGVMHRDLKPANIKITPDGVIKILDFGLARAWLGDSEENVDPAHSPTITAAMTQAGVILGTAAYMSPEQARGKRVDRRSDIWSFGVILVEMLRGKMLFAGETISDSLASVLKAEIDLGTLPAKTPARLRELIERCLDRNPATRLRDIGEARITLERPLGNAGIEKAPRSSRRGRNFVAGALAGVLLGAVGITIFAPEESGTPERQVRFSIPRMSSSGVPRSAISPDGSQLLYVDQGQLWIRDFAAPESRAVTGTDGALVCTWSPDGQSIAWSTSAVIYRSNSDGSQRSRVSEIASDMHQWAGGLQWSDDGHILYVPGDSGIYSVTATGGDPEDYLPTAEGDTDFHNLALLPGDGGALFHPHIDLEFNSVHLLSSNGRSELFRAPGQQLFGVGYTSGYIVFTRRPDNAGIWAVPFSIEQGVVTGDPFIAVADGVFPSVSSSGDLVYVPASAELWRLVQLNRQGHEITQLGDEIENAGDLIVAPNGRDAAYVVAGQTSEIWIVDLESGQRRRFTYDEQQLRSPSWSPDGERLVYTVGGGGGGLHQEIRSLDGRSAIAIDVRGFSPQFTPDERFLLLEFWDEANEPSIGYVDLEDLEKGVTPIVDTRFAENSPRLSPDGQIIVYESLASGRREVYATTFPEGGTEWQLSSDGGSAPTFSTDGSEIYFRNSSFPVKMVVDVSYDPIRFSAARTLFQRNNIGWMNATEDGEFWVLEGVAGTSAGSYEVWLGWADTLAP